MLVFVKWEIFLPQARDLTIPTADFDDSPDARAQLDWRDLSAGNAPDARDGAD